jgi:hypothetical protein
LNASNHIDVLNRLRVVGCPTCAILFALPLEIYLRRMTEKGNIFCPNGHVALLTPESETPEELAILQVEMVAEIRQLKHDADQLRNTLGRMPHAPEGPISDEELERRIKYLVNRAKTTAYGRLACRFCESVSKHGPGLKRHLKRLHRDEIAAISSEYFDEP